MNLLFDQNLSPRLADLLQELFPGSVHVLSVALDTASDHDVWNFARQGDFSVVTKDADFNEMAVLNGSPPKIIWLQLGNCTTSDVEAAFRSNSAAILEFCDDESASTLMIPRAEG